MSGGISCYMKLAKERFVMKALFKTLLGFLSEAKNKRISYVYETHEVEIIILHRSFDFTDRKLRSIML